MRDNQEPPVIQLGSTTVNRNMAFAAVAAAVLVIAVVASVLFWPESTPEDVEVAGSLAQTDPVAIEPAAETTFGDTSDDESTPAPTGSGDAVALDQEAAGSWTVVGTDNLNIRQAPGTASDVIGSLAAGQQGVAATGERATINGAEWKQIQYGDQANLGWVSALYLAPDADSPSVAPADQTLCFQSGETGRQIALRLTRSSSGQQWAGIMREDSDSTTSYDSVNGTGAGPAIDVTMTDTADSSERTATWMLDGQSLVFMDGTPVRIVPCTDITGLLPAS